MEFIRHMAIMEAQREKCPFCHFGNYNYNEIKCRTCRRDCPYITRAMPTAAQIERATTAIKSYFAQEENHV